MKYLGIILFGFVILLLVCNCNDKEQIESSRDSFTHGERKQKKVLLIGTFHYNNPGADVAKTKSFDILKEESQKELEFIANKIATFKPTKIFVEWDYDEQTELDSLYRLYRKGDYFKDDDLSDFYRKNEIFQLAFRIAKKVEVTQVIGIDYKTEFPFDSLMTVLAKNHQSGIQARITEMLETFTEGFDRKIESGESLLNLTYYLNSPELRAVSNEFHSQIPLLVGSRDNLIGPFLTSEWYKRNLYMWSFVQKEVEKDDERIMVLIGASHAALIKNFIDENSDWKNIELESVIKE